MADWANLPNDLLPLIAEQLYSIKEFVCFGVVCKSWLLATLTLKEDSRMSSPKLPCLMLAEEEIDAEKAATEDSRIVPYRCFFNLSTRKTHELELPEISRRMCLGVNYGWLFTLGYDLQINLFHPFSRYRVSLPPLLSFSDHYDYEIFTPQEVIYLFIKKVAVSAHPKQHDCMVMAIYGKSNILAFARPGDKLWTNVPAPSKCYEDVVYYKDHFYAVDFYGAVVVCDIDGIGSPKYTVVASPPAGTEDWFQKYLVESSGDLLLVSQVREDDDGTRYYTTSFSILKMEECSDENVGEYTYYWVPVKSLGDRALFIGGNTSVSLSVSLSYNYCFKENCIYFTDGNPEMWGRQGGQDMGIFDIETGTIEPHYDGVSLSYLSPPVWLT